MERKRTSKIPQGMTGQIDLFYLAREANDYESWAKLFEGWLTDFELDKREVWEEHYKPSLDILQRAAVELGLAGVGAKPEV